ncbi:SAM-dependent methyltransferase [Candidatus Marsarchaeota G2 archaeon OSP_D]|jgi:Methylase involved in ubiquinone/menaquinone biosynthesis|uniref:SAM-dependent methyltransferase n=1 Tax=Candidatus Marsarchaeota G2 archaeon OSP_D TaxID=1978157 RepID=A0A2R6ABD5_9ARCH|nr:MAG: SAM-dependent methyltransferase [Candidatus Marsarchaeota G2 archaeon OSP_D]
MVRVSPFEALSQRYDAWFESHFYAYLSELEAVRRCVGSPQLALEVGVGTGRFAGPLGISFGIDPSLKMLEVAHSRGINVVRGVAERLPFRDSAFDLVLMVTTICFIDDVEASFREARRVLRSGGRFLVGFIDSESLLGKRLKAMKDNPFYAEATLYSVKEVVDYLERAGFSVHEFLQTIFGSPEDLSAPEPIKQGFGEGSFVVVCAEA